MSSSTFRVTIRGAFDALTSAQRDELLAHAGDHDVSYAAFTEQGSMTYDIAARPFFTFRYQGAGEQNAIVAAAEAAAVGWLDARGLAYKNLASKATDLAEVPLGARGRRIYHNS